MQLHNASHYSICHPNWNITTNKYAQNLFGIFFLRPTVSANTIPLKIMTQMQSNNFLEKWCNVSDINNKNILTPAKNAK